MPRALVPGRSSLRNNSIPVSDASLSVDEILARLAEQPKTIAALTARLSRARLQRAPSHGEWSLNHELAHLRSCSDIWGAYMATIAAEDHPTIRAMNPTTWIKETDYPNQDFAPSLAAYMRQRTKLMSFLRKLPREAWSRTALVTGAGKPRERTLMEYAMWLARHERSHVKHIARVVGRKEAP